MNSSQLKEKLYILDTIIEVSCKSYGIEPAELLKPGKSCKRVAETKKVISYLNPIFNGPHYRILMARLGYGEKTQSRHTRNRKEVLKRMGNDEAYKIAVAEIKQNVNCALISGIVNDVEALMAKYPMDLSITITARGIVTSLNRGVK